MLSKKEGSHIFNQLKTFFHFVTKWKFHLSILLQLRFQKYLDAHGIQTPTPTQKNKVCWSSRLMYFYCSQFFFTCSISLQLKIITFMFPFSSSELKTQMSFSNQNPSFVCHLTFHNFCFFRATGQVPCKLATKYPCLKGVQVCS